MKIIVMDTGRGTKAETVALWRERLELADGDVLSLLTWRAPTEPLPVGEHFVFGPHLDLRRREPRRAWTQAEADVAAGSAADRPWGDTGGAGDTGAHHPDDSEDYSDDYSEDSEDQEDTEDTEDSEADVSSLGDTELSAQLSEQMTDRKDRHVSGGVGDVEGGHHGRPHGDPHGSEAQRTTDAGTDDVDDVGEAGEAAGPGALHAPHVPSGASDDGHPDGAKAHVGDAVGDAVGEDVGEHLGDPSSIVDPVAARPGPDRSLLALPVYHPRRLRQAARWRANRVRLAARRGYRAGKRYLRRSPGVTARTARRVVGVYGGGIATEFAVAAARSRGVEGVFRSADVVVPVDARSQRAAWVLARRFDGPDVVVTYPAAVRAIDARRAPDPLEGS